MSTFSTISQMRQSIPHQTKVPHCAALPRVLYHAEVDRFIEVCMSSKVSCLLYCTLSPTVGPDSGPKYLLRTVFYFIFIYPLPCVVRLKQSKNVKCLFRVSHEHVWEPAALLKPIVFCYMGRLQCCDAGLEHRLLCFACSLIHYSHKSCEILMLERLQLIRHKFSHSDLQ